MFIHRESDTEVHVYADPRVISKAALQAELSKINRMLALGSEDVAELALLMGLRPTAEADPTLRLNARKAEIEATLKWWDARTSRLTFTEIKL